MKSTSDKTGTTQKEKPTYLREIEIRYRKRRVPSDSPVGKPIQGIKQVLELFSDLQNETKEKLITVSLDGKNTIICFEVVAIGSVASIYLRPFEAIRASLPLNPRGVIILHNHPSGDPIPSRDDKSFTKELKKLTDAGGLAFLDHVIIGDGDYYSFAEEGKL
jgi:DNA repair protein RadC